MPTNRGGLGGEPREALELAQLTAVEAVEGVIEVLRNPERNSQSKLAAAKLLLDVAGVGAMAADLRHTELLASLRGKVSDGAWAEVVRALAGNAAVSSDDAADTSGLQ